MKSFVIRIILLALCIRCLVAVLGAFSPQIEKNFDIASYIHVGFKTLTGGGITSKVALGNHPYFPFMMFIEAEVMWVAIALKLKPELLFRLVFSLTDALVILPLYFLTKRKNPLILYALNPVSILISSYQGQFDSLPLFFLLMSLFYLGKKKLDRFYLWANLAVSIKTWPLLFLSPLVLKYLKLLNIFYLCILPLTLTVGYSILFHVNPVNILFPVAVYRGFPGLFGIGLFLQLFQPNKIANLLLSSGFIFLLVLFSIRNKARNIVKETTVIMLLFFLFTPTFAIQWLMWMIPFLLMTDFKKSKLLFIAMSLYIVMVYFAPQSVWFTRTLCVGVGIGVWILMLKLVFKLLKENRDTKSLNL